MKNYLSNEVDVTAYQFVDAIPEKKIQNYLAILKEEVSNLIPLTAKKQVDEHYGFPVDNAEGFSSLLSIPYHGCDNPTRNSQFGTDLEILNYAIQAHLGKGISLELVQREISDLKELSIKEYRDKKIKRVQDSSSYQRFEKLCGSNVFNLFALSETDLKRIQNHINQKPHLQMELIRKYVLPELKVYPKQISTSAQIFALLLRRMKGFSGTLWNAETYPEAFSEMYFSDTEVKTLHLLWKKSPHQISILPGNFSKAEELFQQLAGAGQDPRGSFADLGGIFKGIKNIEVAKSMLEINPNMRGVVYYDDDDQLMVLIRQRDLPVALSKCKLSKNEIVAFWDQKHTTGSDIKLGAQMTATVTVSRHTMMRDLLQTVWRLRELEKGQNVVFSALKEDAEVIREALKKVTGNDIDGPFTLKEISLYVKYNEAMRQGDDNHRSLKQKWQSVLVEPLLQIFVDPDIHPNDLLKVFNDVKDLFVTDKIQDPYDVYGRPMGTGPSEEVIREEEVKFLEDKPMIDFEANPILVERFQVKSLVEEIRWITQKEISKLPNLLARKQDFETEVHVEVEAEEEQEQETKSEKETETQKEKYSFNRNTEGRPPIPWSPESLFLNQSYQPWAYAEISKA